MADRTVKVSLVLQAQGYMQGVSDAARKTRELGTETEKLAQKREVFTAMGTAATGMGAAVGAAVGVAVAKFAEFDAQMSAVRAATHETASNMNLLRDAALDAGSRTVYSATEAAGAVEELARAGVSTKDILSGGLDAALDLAAAGGMQVAEAAGIAAVAMKTFGLSGGDVTRVADNLAAGAGKAMGDVSDLGQALSQAGTVAASTGLSIQETTAGLASFASAGILGSDAGTSFRSMLMRLTPQSKEAEDAMRELGVRAFDSQGEFIGLSQFAGNLNDVFGEMDTEARNAALGVIFGSDAIRAANILIDEGETGIRNWISAVDDQGYAAETASTRLDNLKGDWEAFTGALDTAFISMGEGANGPLRGFVQGLTSVVDNFNDLPDWGQQTALGVGAVGAAALTGAGLFLLAVPKVAEYRKAIEEMGGSTQRAGRFIGGLGRAAGVAAGLMILATAANAAAEGMGMAADGAESLESTLSAMRSGRTDVLFQDLTSDVTDLTSGLELLLGGGFNSQAERFGSQLNGIFFGGQLADGVRNTREQFETMGEALGQMVRGGDAERAEEIFYQIASAAQEQGYSIEQIRDLMPGYQNALDGVANETAAATTATEANVEALAALEGGAADADGSVRDLADTIRNFGAATLDTREAERQFEAALDDLTATLAENGATLDVGTEAGRANEAALDDLVTKTLELSAATLEQTGSEAEATAVLESGRAKLVEVAEQFGMTRDEAEAYADQLGLLPENIDQAVNLQGVDDAITKLQSLKAWADSIPSVKTITLETITLGGLGPGGGRVISADGTVNARGNLYVGGKAKEFAAGGWASGIYPATRGGLHKFAEAGFDEAFITMDPRHRERSLRIHHEVGERLGAAKPSPDYVLAQQWAASSAAAAPAPYSPTIIQRPGVSDKRIAQVAVEEYAFATKK